MALAIELLALAASIVLAPIQLGVEIGRLLVGLPVALAEVGIYLLAASAAIGLLAGASTAFKGRLSERGRVRILQTAALLTCALLQVYGGVQLLRFLAMWDGTEREFVLPTLLLGGPALVLVAFAGLWLRAPSGMSSAVAVLAGALLLFGTSRCTSASFSSSAWKEDERGRGPTTRQLLVERLIGCGTLEGADKTQVRGLLGEPDRREALERAELERNWSYEIGPKRTLVSISGNTEVLYLTFGRVGKVQSVAILE